MARPRQRNGLRTGGGRIVDQGVGVPPVPEPAIRLIASVGKGFRGRAQAGSRGGVEGRRARQADEHEVRGDPAHGSGDRGRHPGVAGGSVVERAVGLDVPKVRPSRPGSGDDELQLLDERRLEVVGGQVEIAPPEPVPVGVGGVGADRRPGPQRPIDRRRDRGRVACVPAARDVHRGHEGDQRLVVGESLTDVRVQVDGHGGDGRPPGRLASLETLAAAPFGRIPLRGQLPGPTRRVAGTRCRCARHNRAVGLIEEIREQPAVVERLLERGRGPVARIAEALRDRGIDGLHIAARGTSDHAAIYAQYLLGARHGLPVALAAPSLVTLYGAAPRFGRAAVVGISQSGASPDVVGVLEAARGQGAPTIAITNEPASPLARAAEFLIDLGAGPERAVAATKTYTAELTAIAMLSAALGDDPAADRELAGLPAAIARALEAEAAAEAAAAGHAGVTGCVVLGRGFEYATAREWALKIKELARVMADPYSAADFQHGPLALIDPGFPVLAVATSGPVAPGMLELLARLRDDHGADIVAITDLPGGVAANAILPLPSGVPEWLLPIVSIVPGQFFAAALARVRGLDPETPRHIRKVTLTR